MSGDGGDTGKTLTSPFSSRFGGTLTPSNVGFQLLQKSGWKEGSGLGVAEQGRLEPVDVFVKNDKRGIGSKLQKQKTNTTLKQAVKMQEGKGLDGIAKHVISKKASRRLRKELENDRKSQEQHLQRNLFMDFWPDNV